jgi:hypothetical protein
VVFLAGLFAFTTVINIPELQIFTGERYISLQ